MLTHAILGVSFVFLLYQTYWFFVAFGYKEKVGKNHLTSFPTVTIAVPAFNEEKTIAGTLNSLLKLSYPREKLRIVCINDGSKDNTGKLCDEFAKKHSHISVIHQQNQGKHVALNAALAKTTSTYFACLDADSTVDKDALTYLIADLEINTKLAASMPVMHIRNVQNWITRIQDIEYMTSVFLKKLNEVHRCVSVTPGPLSVFRTKTIQSIGGYKKAHMTEDLEMGLRLQLNHLPVTQNMQAKVYTKAPSTWYAFYRQRLRWNKGTFLNAWAYKRLMFSKDYADFGAIQLPMIGVAGMAGAILFLMSQIMNVFKLYDQVKALILVNFDIVSLIKAIEWRFDYLAFLSFDSLLSYLGIVMLIFLAAFLHMAYKSVNRPYKIGDAFSGSLYFILYGLITSFFWFMTFFHLLTRKQLTWK
jgi:cellulose synthase/poly-beta-1,6-N-acetylglucosamine synthase-like glycosyltransferase